MNKMLVKLVSVFFLIQVLSFSTIEINALTVSPKSIQSVQESIESEDRWVRVGKVISDPKTLADISYKTDIKSILESKNSIEIRLEIEPSFFPSNYIILRYNNKKWKMRYLYHAKNNRFEKKSKEICTEKNLQELFETLVNNNIFSLPDQSEINEDEYDTEYNLDKEWLRDYPLHSSKIMDGTSYSIEFKIGNSYRRYTYHEPFFYAKTYPLIKEYTYMKNIIIYFSKCAGITFE